MIELLGCAMFFGGAIKFANYLESPKKVPRVLSGIFTMIGILILVISVTPFFMSWNDSGIIEEREIGKILEYSEEKNYVKYISAEGEIIKLRASGNRTFYCEDKEPYIKEVTKTWKFLFSSYTKTYYYIYIK